MRVADEADVLGAKSEGANVLIDERRRLWQSTVEEDQPRLITDEQRRQSIGPDVVGIAEDLERCERTVPFGAVGALVGRVRLNLCGDGVYPCPRRNGENRWEQQAAQGESFHEMRGYTTPIQGPARQRVARFWRKRMTRFIPATVVLGAIVFAAPITLSSAPPTAAARAMSDAAASFLKDLSAEQRSKATFKFEDDSRFEFRFTPRTGLRTGMPLKEMSEAQRAKAHALLKTGLSVRGYTTATTIIELETVLQGDRAGSNGCQRHRARSGVVLRFDLRRPGGKIALGLEVRRASHLGQLHGRRRQTGRVLRPRSLDRTPPS